MCGRITLSANLTEILARFELTKSAPEVAWKPLYNGSPGQFVPVVLSTERNVLSFARWGLIPSWAKDEKIGYKLINARAEGIAEKPSYRSAWKNGQRCLVVVDGFFEWKMARRAKEPYCIRQIGHGPFALAGLWEKREKDAQSLLSFTIITTSPNTLMKPIHDRMPVILPKAIEKQWLKPEVSSEQALDFLIPYGPGDLEAILVSSLVNNPKNNSSEVLAPLVGGQIQSKL